jgi:thiamine biosynthesis lipoprotein
MFMGTAITIEVVDPAPNADAGMLIERAFAWFREVDERFSTYKPGSEVNRIDRGELSAAHASPDMRAVLDACAELHASTRGYFDVYATGRFDPSGYVKGWSVRVASDRMYAAGARNHCINAGGDIMARGHAPGGGPWRIGIAHPWQADKVAWVLAGYRMAVATSGTYERGLHVIDPFRGVPADALCSVTVTGLDLAIADAYATAALAMGERGPEWLAMLDGYESAVITADGLPTVDPGEPNSDGPPTVDPGEPAPGSDPPD